MRYKDIHVSPWIYVLSFILAVNMYTYPFIIAPWLVAEGPSWLGLDVSWLMVLNYANIQDWIWGKDIVYTYGPLGFLATRLGWGVSSWIFLVFDLFLMTNFFFVFKDFLKASSNILMGFFILFCMTFLMSPNHGSDLSWVLYFLVAYWAFRSYKVFTNGTLVILGLLTLITFYVKMNTGLLAFLIFIGNIFILFITEKISLKKSLIALLLLTAGLYLSSLLLHVSLPGYIKGSLEMIKGYKEVMYLDQNLTNLESNLLYIYRLVLYLLAIYAVYIVFVKGKLAQVYYVLITFAYIFLLKVQAYHRGDEQHLVEMYSYGPLILIAGNLIYYKGRTHKFFLGSIAFITGVALLYKVEHVSSINELYKNRYLTKGSYIDQVRGAGDIEYIHQKDKRYIPRQVLNKIGNSSIDIFPWDCAYILEHKLNYKPRPVFQSFAAYTPYLQQLNYNSYLNDPPEFIIYDYESIDSRYAFCDEPLLNLFILKNYHTADTFYSNGRTRALLEKNNEVYPLEITMLDKKTVDIEKIVPEVDNANFLKIYLDYNKKGTQRGFLKRPPGVFLHYVTMQESIYDFKTSIELLKGGVLVGKLVTNLQEFTDFDNSAPEIYWFAVGAKKEYFEPEMIVEYYNVK